MKVCAQGEGCGLWAPHDPGTQARWIPPRRGPRHQSGAGPHAGQHGLQAGALLRPGAARLGCAQGSGCFAILEGKPGLRETEGAPADARVAGSCAQTALREQVAVPRRGRRRCRLEPAAPLRAGAEAQRRVASEDPGALARLPRSAPRPRGPRAQLSCPRTERSRIEPLREGLSASSRPGGPRSQTLEPRGAVAQAQSEPRVWPRGEAGVTLRPQTQVGSPPCS